MREYLKDPDAALDYVFNWGAWLEDGEEIVTSVFLLDGTTTGTLPWTPVVGGLTVTAKSVTLLTATIWISGGTAGNRYTITNRVTSDAGRVDDRSVRIRVADR